MDEAQGVRAMFQSCHGCHFSFGSGLLLLLLLRLWVIGGGCFPACALFFFFRVFIYRHPLGKGSATNH